MPGRPFLEGDAVDRCAVAEDDLEFRRETLNDPAVWPSLSARTPLTGKQEREWYEEHASADNGSVDFGDGSAEVGIFLAEAFWGNGYGTEAGRLVTDYAFV